MKVVYLKIVKGYTCRQAIEQAHQEFPSLELPPSYFKYPGTHVHRFQDELLKAASDGDPDVIGHCRRQGLRFQKWEDDEEGAGTEEEGEEVDEYEEDRESS